jgi:hypothetical protein
MFPDAGCAFEVLPCATGYGAALVAGSVWVAEAPSRGPATVNAFRFGRVRAAAAVFDSSALLAYGVVRDELH